MFPVNFLVLILVILGIAIAFSVLSPSKKKPYYLYRRKQFFMSRPENEFYKILTEAVGNDYFIFAQVHLPTILDHTVRGQDWRAAKANIDRRSVDFVLCDKTYISPKLAIELDDKSHEQPDRRERDEKVEKILESAGVPLLRLKSGGVYSPQELSEEIRKVLR